MPVAKVYNSNTGQWEPVLVGDTGPQGPSGTDATLTKSIRTETADTTLLAGDANQIVRFNGTSAQTLTVPDVLGVGQRVEIVQDNSGSVELASGSGVTLLSTTGGFGLTGQNAKTELVCVAAGEYRLYGDVVEPVSPNIEYLVIAGGGSGGEDNNNGSGGGGAGGYRSSVSGESSGGGASAETPLEIGTDILLGTSYVVTVGAGAPAKPVNDGAAEPGDKGSNSVFSTITSIGGGGGGGASGMDDGNGGSGGGAGSNSSASSPLGSGTVGQGFDGGLSNTSIPSGGGGGGAAAAGENATSGASGDGGDGLASSITGSAVTRAGGGGGAATSGTLGAGGAGGGGNGVNSGDAGNGATNSGSGGGAAANLSETGSSGAGGSGIVILRYSASYTINIGAGLTGTEATVDNNKVATITAGTGNVSWS